MENLYSGAHARQGAYTRVTSTAINVTGGTYGRVYGGGWGENYGKSEVGSSTISVSGGTLGYIYAGGGNAKNGTTVTGNVTISITDDANVGIVFLAGKNQNCSVEGAATLTLSGGTKTMSRISGWNANGKASSGLSTLDLQTSLNVDYLDNVDVIRIAENSTLDVSTHLWYEAAAALKIDFDLDGAEADWVAMSGADFLEDDFNLIRSAQYTINGGTTTYAYNATTGELGNSGCYLDIDTTENKIRFHTTGTIANS